MFEQVQFPTSKPQMHQASVIQQQPQQQGGGGGSLLGSLFGMGLNYLMPGMGSLATGLISGNPRQAVGGVAEMAGLSGAGGGGDIGSGAPGQSPTQPSPNPNPSNTKGSGESEDKTSNSSPSPEQQKIDTGDSEGDPSSQNGSLQDPSAQLQQLLAMMYLQQMFQGQNPSMFPMPPSPVQGMNPAARSPITGMTMV